MIAVPQLTFTPVEEIPKIVSDLRASFLSGITLNLEFRKEQLMALHRMVSENTEVLVEALYSDLHKCEYEALFTEIRAVDYEIGYQLENFEKWVAPSGPAGGSAGHQPGYASAALEIRKAPHGVVTAISPWNYPVRLTLLPLIGMIAAGNVVVVKQSEVSAHTSAVISELLEKYLDRRVVRVVNGAVAETTALLEQRVDHICFTGSGAVGKIVARAAAQNLSKLTLELGGKCPAVVTSVDASELDVVARRIVWGKFVNCGQTCLAVDYVLVDKVLHFQLIEKMKLAVKEFYSEAPKMSEEYGRIISERQFDRIAGLVSRTSGKFAMGGSLEDWDRSELFIPPTIIDGVDAGDALFSEELFAPILPVVAINSHVDAINHINQHDHPLSLYCFTTDKLVMAEISDRTRSGSLVFNDSMMHTGSHSLPFGGVGPSGCGCYMGKASIDNFSHHRSVLVSKLNDLNQKLDGLRFPPFSGPQNSWKFELVSKLLYPKWPVFRTGFFERIWALFPGWRIVSAFPLILKRLLARK